MTLAAALAGSGCREASPPAAAQKESKPAVAESLPVEESKPQAQEAQETQNRLAEDRSRPEAPQPVIVPVGTDLSGNLESTVSSDKSRVGDQVEFRTSRAVIVGQRAVVPAGSTVVGTVTHVHTAGRMKGAAELTIRFTELQLPDGTSYPVTCEPLRLVHKGDGKETAAQIGGGAAVGGIVGGVAGGGDGALKGAVIGAAVGTGVAAATKGEQIVLPEGKPITVRLSAPIEI